MVKIGIIGFGKMGKIRARAVQKTGLGEIVAVYEPEKEVEFGGLPRVDSSEAIIGHPDIEAIFVCTPNYLNKPLTISGLKAGKHVFCEKPPAFTAEDVEEIRRVESASGKKLMYGFNHRHHRSIGMIKELIDAGKFGKVLWMRGRYGKSVDEDFYQNWRSKKELSGGGILIDQGIHMIDLMLYLGGEFDDIHAFVSSLFWKIGAEDNVFAILRNTQTGLVASLHSTMTQWRHLFALEIFLEEGYMVLNGLQTSSGTYGDEILSIARNRTVAPRATWEDEEKITFHTDNSWESEIRSFFSCISENSNIELGNSADALNLMRVIDRIYENR